jgi:hypothetical protein
MSDQQKPGSDPAPSGSGSLGFKFNQVGREEAATEIYRPQIDPATKQRRALIIGLVAVFFVLMLYINWVRTGKVNPFEAPHDERTFGAPAPQIPQ